MSPRASVDALEKRLLHLPRITPRFLCRTACNLSTELGTASTLSLRAKAIDLIVLTMLIREN